MEEKNQVMLKQYVSLNMKFFNFTTLSSGDENAGTLRRLNDSFVLFVHVSTLVYYVTLWLNIYQSLENLPSWSDSATIVVGLTCNFYVVYSVTRNWSSIRKLVADLNTGMAAVEREFNIPDALSIEKTERQNTAINRTLLIFTVTFSTLLPAIPYSELAFSSGNRTVDVHKPAGSVRGRYWVPFDTTPVPTMIVLYLFEAMILVFNAPHFYNSCGLVFSLCNHMKVRFKILQHLLSDIKTEATARVNKRKTFSDAEKEPMDITYENAVNFKISLHNRMSEKLVKYIKYHQCLLSLCADMSKIVAPITLAIVLLTILNLCLASFQASMVPVTDTAFIGYFIGASVVLSGMMMLGWSCSEVTKQSSLVVYAAYSSDWYDASDNYKKSLLLVMTRANKGVLIIAGGVTDVDMNTSIQVMRAAYSFFTILRSIRE